MKIKYINIYFIIYLQDLMTNKNKVKNQRTPSCSIAVVYVCNNNKRLSVLIRSDKSLSLHVPSRKMMQHNQYTFACGWQFIKSEIRNRISAYMFTTLYKKRYIFWKNVTYTFEYHKYFRFYSS